MSDFSSDSSSEPSSEAGNRRPDGEPAKRSRKALQKYLSNAGQAYKNSASLPVLEGKYQSYIDETRKPVAWQREWHSKPTRRVVTKGNADGTIGGRGKKSDSDEEEQAEEEADEEDEEEDEDMRLCIKASVESMRDVVTTAMSFESGGEDLSDELKQYLETQEEEIFLCFLRSEYDEDSLLEVQMLFAPLVQRMVLDLILRVAKLSAETVCLIPFPFGDAIGEMAVKLIRDMMTPSSSYGNMGMLQSDVGKTVGKGLGAMNSTVNLSGISTVTKRAIEEAFASLMQELLEKVEDSAYIGAEAGAAKALEESGDGKKKKKKTWGGDSIVELFGKNLGKYGLSRKYLGAEAIKYNGDLESTWKSVFMFMRGAGSNEAIPAIPVSHDLGGSKHGWFIDKIQGTLRSAKGTFRSEEKNLIRASGYVGPLVPAANIRNLDEERIFARGRDISLPPIRTRKERDELLADLEVNVEGFDKMEPSAKASLMQHYARAFYWGYVLAILKPPATGKASFVDPYSTAEGRLDEYLGWLRVAKEEDDPEVPRASPIQTDDEEEEDMQAQAAKAQRREDLLQKRADKEKKEKRKKKKDAEKRKKNSPASLEKRLRNSNETEATAEKNKSKKKKKKKEPKKTNENNIVNV